MFPANCLVLLVDRDNFCKYRMSDPGTTYRTREEVQRMRSTQDPIRGLQRYIEEWGLASEEELKVGFLFRFPNSGIDDAQCTENGQGRKGRG